MPFRFVYQTADISMLSGSLDRAEIYRAVRYTNVNSIANQAYKIDQKEQYKEHLYETMI